MAGQPTERGQRWSTRHPRRIRAEKRAAKQQAAKERAMVRESLDHHARSNPGAVVEVGSARKVDLSGEPGHVQSITATSGRDQRGGYHRVRVACVMYGAASDVSEELDGERVPAGELTPSDVHAAFTGGHSERFRDGRTVEERVAAVEEYITDRWDPAFPERERVSGRMGDADE